MLTLDQVALSLGQRHWLFDHRLETQGIYALLGRSGSGKSTLLNLIAGFQRPDSGGIAWNQQSLLGLEPAQRPVTSLFQANNLFTHLTVFQNIGLGIAADLKLNAQAKTAIGDVLAQVGLAGYEKKLPGALSGGEQQRVALARCLLRHKPILLLDEPFSALDATTRQEMIELLLDVIARLRPLVVMVTHDEDDASAMGASVLRIANGTLSPDSPAGEPSA